MNRTCTKCGECKSESGGFAVNGYNKFLEPIYRRQCKDCRNAAQRVANPSPKRGEQTFYTPEQMAACRLFNGWRSAANDEPLRWIA